MWTEILFGSWKFFGGCVSRIPQIKHAEKMVKICQTGLLKLKFEFIPKNAFSGFCQKYSQAMDEVEYQGWVGIPKNVKKSKITAPFCIRPHSYCVYRRRSSESARVIARVRLLVRESRKDRSARQGWGFTKWPHSHWAEQNNSFNEFPRSQKTGF